MEVELELVQDSNAQLRSVPDVSLASTASARSLRLWSFCWQWLQDLQKSKKLQRFVVVSQCQEKKESLAKVQIETRSRLGLSGSGHKYLERVPTYPSLLLPVQRQLSYGRTWNYYSSVQSRALVPLRTKQWSDRKR